MHKLKDPGLLSKKSKLIMLIALPTSYNKCHLPLIIPGATPIETIEIMNIIDIIILMFEAI